MIDREAFHEERRSGLGATDSAKVLGLTRWGTALTVYEDKVNPAPEKESLYAWLGLKLEGAVAELYTATSGIRVRAARRQFRHPKHRWMVCHLDFRAVGDRTLIVEAKTRSSTEGWGPDGSDEVPVDIWVQVQHEMAVVGATNCHIATLFGHRDFRVFEIVRNDEFIAELIPQLDTFWHEHVLARVPPEPSASVLDESVLRRRYPEDAVPALAATSEQEGLVDGYLLARHNREQAEQAELGLKLKLIDLIGDASGLRGAFGEVTFKRSKDSEEVAWKEVAGVYKGVALALLDEAEPDLKVLRATLEVAEGVYTNTKPGSRRFLVTEKQQRGAA